MTATYSSKHKNKVLKEHNAKTYSTIGNAFQPLKLVCLNRICDREPRNRCLMTSRRQQISDRQRRVLFVGVLKKRYNIIWGLNYFPFETLLIIVVIL